MIDEHEVIVPFGGLALSVSGLALSVIPSGCHLSRSERQGLFRCVLGSPFGRAVERSETERASLPFPPAGLPSPSSLRDATSPSRGGFGRPLGFSSSPEAPLLGELSSGARLRGCMGGFSARETAASGFGIQRLCLRRSSCFVQPLRHPFGMPPPLVGEALAGRWAFPLRQRLPY